MTSILITGGSGTLGTALTRRLLQNPNVTRLAIFSRDELKQSELKKLPGFDDPRLRWFIGDVRDKDRLYRAFDGVDTVIHAAAMKQVDSCTVNALEAVKTNVMGTVNVIEAAIDRNVERVMAISSDKACSPVTLYGKTKSVLEGLITGAGYYVGKHKTKFAACRYGNVAASRGSVIPAFMRLISEGKEATITDARMTRFWMRLDQAVHFVLYSLDNMAGGEVFIPRLPSFYVTDLAKAMGARFTVSGVIRPNEKLSESMLSTEESREARDYGDHFRLYCTRGGIQIPEGLEYASGTNPNFLSVDNLRQELTAVL